MNAQISPYPPKLGRFDRAFLGEFDARPPETDNRPRENAP